MKLCLCGCGKEVKKRNKYLQGHNPSSQNCAFKKLFTPIKYCECGCGQITTYLDGKYKKFITGHNMKIKKELIGRKGLWKKGQRAWNKNLKFPPEKHPNWQGGKSFEPYGIEFNNQLKEFIRKRDQFRCQQCFRHQSELFRIVKGKKYKKYKLYVHHIDYNKQNNNPNNLISLCLNCHAQTNFNRDDWVNYFEEKIGGIRC